jgi:hypothetical protein
MATWTSLCAALGTIGRLMLLMPFVLASLLGDGVMPRQTADGLTLVLCTVEGPVEVTLDPATGAPVVPAQDGAGNGCDWTCAQGGLPPPGAARIPAPLVLCPAEPLRDVLAFAPAHDPRGLFARGPPTLS